MKKIFWILLLSAFFSLKAYSNELDDENSPFTTEFQARVTGNDKILNALNKFGVEINSCSVVEYEIYDTSDGILSKNNIVIRYRDKGKSVDLCVKFKLEYNSEVMKTLAQYFSDITIKKEVNRYYNFGGYGGQNVPVELTFRSKVKKKDLGLEKEDTLSNGKKLDMFDDIIKQIVDNYPKADPGNKVLTSIRSKMDLLMKESLKKQTFYVKRSNRCKWEIEDWKGYEAMDAEYSNTQGPTPFLEISTRVTGDVNSNEFFNKLKASGIVE
jgi:hypothetical protein